MRLAISRKEFPLRKFQMFVKLTLTYQPFYSPNTHKVLWWNNDAHFLLTAATSPTVQRLNLCDLPRFGISLLYDLFSFCLVPYSCDRALPTFSQCSLSSLWNSVYVISPRPIKAICTLNSVWTLIQCLCCDSHFRLWWVYQQRKVSRLLDHQTAVTCGLQQHWIR
jgi:hypothetical protein